jgi:PAS domain S-box-containing protein
MAGGDSAGDEARTAETKTALIDAIFVHAPFSVALYDRAGRVALGNAAYERHFGIRLADVPPDFSLFTDPQLAAAGLLPLIRRAYDGEHVLLPPVKYDAAAATGRHGHTRWTQGHCYPVRDAEGTVTHIAIVHADVSERMEAESRLRALNLELAAEREALRRVVAQLPAAVAVYEGPELRFRAMSAAYRRIIGDRDVIGVPIREALSELSGDEDFFALIEYVRDTGETITRAGVPARWASRNDGVVEERVVDLVYAPLRGSNADGPSRVEGVIALVLDVTARARAEDALRENEQRYRQLAEAERAARADAEQARERAEDASAARGQFLATMSHELRTPLNAIAGHCQLLELGIHGSVTDSQREALARVNRAQRHLLGLINDVLNYARLESGRVEYDLMPVRVADAVTDVVPMIEPQLSAKGLEFDVRLPDDADARSVLVRADREKLGQVLLNLLSNAVKFTPTGGRVVLELAARREGQMPDDVVFLRVSDTGVGIPHDKLEAVFEPFVQIRSGYAEPSSGTGLGLAISRDLARGMGGDLRARSDPGKGSSFTMTLKKASVSASAS